MQCQLVLLLGALATLSDARLESTGNKHPTKLNPPLKDVKSDKKFFGPPFPADYPDDKRPVADKSILDKLKGPDQPYPALQSKADYDRDFVKDENSDHGHWSAQFEYDALRRKLAREAAEEKRAEGEVDKEAKDASSAEEEVEKARKEVEDATKNRDQAAQGKEQDAGKDGDEGAPPSSSPLEALKKKVKEAEEKYEKAKQNFEQCKHELEEARTNLAELKARQAEMEQQLTAETKLWEEHKTVKLNVKKAKEEAAAAKRHAAETVLETAKKSKAQFDEVLAAKKLKAQLAKNEADGKNTRLEQLKKDFEKATLSLQRIRGHQPGQAAPAPTKSGVQSMLKMAVVPVLAVLELTLA